MGFELKKVEKNIATIEFNIPSNEFQDAITKAYKKNAYKFNIPGFRKGKAPLKIIQRYYGEGIFYEDAIDAIFPEKYDEAIKATNIEPIDKPIIDIVQIGEGQDLILRAEVTVKPEVNLGEYKGIEVEKIEYNVTDEDVENELNKMRERNARLVSIDDRPVQEGDTVLIDFEGFINGEPFEGGKAQNYSLVIGSHAFIEGFEEQLIGKSKNETVDVRVRFPEDYGNESLAGKEAEFKVTIKEIKYKELPELDDEFAKDVSEFDTLDELRADIRKRLQEGNENRAKNEFTNKVIQKVVDNASIEIPDVMIERELDSMERNVDMNLRYQGITLDKYFEVTGTSREDFRNNMRQDAYNNVKTSLVLDKIAEVEKIEVSDDEIEGEIENIAKGYQDQEKFKGSITEDYKEYIKDSLVIRKTINMLVENAKPVEKIIEGVEEK
ncbi:trigger factor [Calorimonas adulescens]|uniref:Trigger factor n=1 Tax=Calorimonas adulescens TaxID=2606906 RepID=A0A5D8QC95_9THEO|nr:trigger factor [Calorimonas adulescens]TZE81714.1 trigger factor [Calorimonas adulescens]